MDAPKSDARRTRSSRVAEIRVRRAYDESRFDTARSTKQGNKEEDEKREPAYLRL